MKSPSLPFYLNNPISNFIPFKSLYDLMHDLTLSLAWNECSIISSNNLQISRTSRHMTFLDPHSFLFFSFFQALPVFLEKLDRVRTIFFPTSLERPSCMTGIEKFLSKWKLLWALEMDDCGLELLPKKIGTQKQLRCICLHKLYKIQKTTQSYFQITKFALWFCAKHWKRCEVHDQP